MNPENHSHQSGENGGSIFDKVNGLKAVVEARLRARGRVPQDINPGWLEHCAVEALDTVSFMNGGAKNLNVLDVADQTIAYCLDDAEFNAWQED